MIFTPDQNTPDVLYYTSTDSNSRKGKILIVDPLMIRTRYIGTGSTTLFYLPENKSMEDDGYVLANGIQVSNYTVITSDAAVLTESVSLTESSFTFTVSDSTDLRTGQKILGQGISAGTFITNINGTTITVNKAFRETATRTINVYGNDRINFTTAPSLGAIIDIYTTASISDDKYHAADRIWSYYKPTETQTAKDFARLMLGAEYSGAVVKGIDFSSTLSEDDIDEDVVGPVFRSYWGLSPADMVTSGGAFIDTVNSYAPEEHVPAQIFDTLDMRIWNDDSTATGMRIFKNMTNNYSYLRLTETTTLSQDLNMTDTVIHIDNVSNLADPNAELGYPGVLFVNGERIEYYTIDRVHNTITNFRRGTQGTGVPDTHESGSIIEDGSRNQIVPDAAFGINLWKFGTKLDANTSELANFLRSSPADLP